MKFFLLCSPIVGYSPSAPGYSPASTSQYTLAMCDQEKKNNKEHGSTDIGDM